tara:strand:- start:2861 stop:3187 length:327 start_codon:yes stop_codon:yes gene_type:complete
MKRLLEASFSAKWSVDKWPKGGAEVTDTLSSSSVFGREESILLMRNGIGERRGLCPRSFPSAAIPSTKGAVSTRRSTSEKTTYSNNPGFSDYFPYLKIFFLFSQRRTP